MTIADYYRVLGILEEKSLMLAGVLRNIPKVIIGEPCDPDDESIPLTEYHRKTCGICARAFYVNPVWWDSLVT